MSRAARGLRVVSVHGPQIGGRLAVPLYLCRVPAGFPSPASDYVESDIDLNECLVSNKLATFFVRVDGDSMEGGYPLGRPASRRPLLRGPAR